MKWFLIPIVATLSICMLGMSVVDAFDCYQCNSAVDPHNCTSDFAAEKYKLPCEARKLGNNDTAIQPEMCRKILFHLDAILSNPANDRVVRTCGYVRPERDCYNRAGFGTRSTVCTCYSEGCNSAPAIPVSWSLLVLFAIAGLAARNLL